ncbi:MAG: hypothetical protein ABW078_08965 [Sedimenticola sp.]
MDEQRPNYSAKIDRALNGSVQDAKGILELISSHLAANKLPPREFNAYLITAIDQILNGTDSDKALNLTHPSSRPKKEKRDLYIAMQYLRLKDSMQALPLRQQLGEKYGIVESGIKRIVAKYRSQALQEMDYLSDLERRNPAAAKWIEDDLARAAEKDHRGRK